MFDLNFGEFSQTITNLSAVISLLTIIVHILFAAGVAKDINNLHRQNIPTQLVSGISWVLATLIGGVFVAIIYWAMHHSSLARRL